MTAFIRRRSGATFTAITCVMASFFAVWQSRVGDPLSRLSRSERPIEARLTAFSYVPLRAKRSGPVTSEVARAASEQLEALIIRERTPDNLHRLALAKLAVAQPHAAKVLLIEASMTRRDDAGLLADLGAAELSLGELHDAAEHSAHALEFDANQKAAAFNWSLALEKLFNRPAAIEAWETYLRIDSTSGWSDEARQHLERLRAPRLTWESDCKLLHPGADRKTVQRIVSRYPKRARVWIEDVLLPGWLQNGSESDLVLMRSMAAIRAAAGDPFIGDVIEHAVVHRTGLTDGLGAYVEGRAAEAKVDMETAGAHYRKAAALLQEAGSPLATVASIKAATTDNYAGRTKEALARLSEVDARLAAGGNRYPSIAAESAWIRGLVYLRAGRPNECLQAFRTGIARARSAADVEDEASITALMATQLESVADPAEAERFRTEALRQLDELNAESRRMYTAYLETGTTALRAGRPRLALAFLDAAVGIGKREHNVMYLADGNAWRALALLDLGQTDAAANTIAEARRAAPQIQTPGFRDRTIGNIEFITGRVNAKTQPAKAIAPYSAALAMWDHYGWKLHIANAYLARGESFLSIGNRASAERDFRSSIAELESQRHTLGEEAMRISYFERADAVFLRLIELLVDDGRVEEALSVAERKRARALLDQIASVNGVSIPLDAQAIASTVDSRTSLLEVTLLDRGAELWLVRNGRVVHSRGTAGREEIVRRAAQQIASIAANDLPNIQRNGRWLFDQLLAPIFHDVPSDSDLVIVADAELQSFPFATLVLPDASFLIDHYSLATAPSASVFLRSSPSAAAETAVLGVAEAAPEGFAALPNAASEAADLTRRYQLGRLLVGPESTPATFLSDAGRAGLVYFAGHAKADAIRPSESALIFQATDGAAVPLTAAAIGQARLRTHPLVVLAACSTGRGRTRRNEGIESLASAFLQAGAKGVVATLWDVDDAPAAVLFRSFHGRLRQGARAADALRDAQRACLHSTNSDLRAPSVWASATVIGTL
jgi:CHAT domain-containing protein